MARRLLAWLLLIPVAAGGILVGHELAYRLTGASAGSVHEYLSHAPQVVAVLASLGLAGLAFQERSVGRPPLWVFALLGPLGFACQEHLERLVHTGEVPVLLASPTFLLGLVLQIPVGLFCAFVARRVAGTVSVRPRRPGAIGAVWLPLSTSPVVRPIGFRRGRATGRAPPILVVS
jgi:hypothetical protein